MLINNTDPAQQSGEVAALDQRYDMKSTQFSSEELNKGGGHSQLHQACRNGPAAKVKSITERENANNICRGKDKDGWTPLHTAVMKGRVDVIMILLDSCPETAREVTATGETCLHTAVVYNKVKALQYLLKWLTGHADYAYLINAKDHDGNTALHLATSRKQLQTLKLFLTSEHPNINKQVEVNALNFGRFTALDILYVLPHSGKIDMEIDKLLRRAGALRARDLADHDANREFFSYRRGVRWCKPPHLNKIRTVILNPKRENAYNVLLLTATLLATLTFHAAMNFPSARQSHNVLQLNEGDSTVTRLFILFNSTGFIGSAAIIIYLLHDFPLKPWPQVSASSMVGSYLCLIRTISPREAMPLLILSIPFLSLAAAGKLFGFSRLEGVT